MAASTSAGDVDDDEDEMAGSGGGVVQDGQGVMRCLHKALKTGKTEVKVQGVAQKAGYVGVLVTILNHHLYYFEQGNRHVTADMLSNLMELIQGKIREHGTAVEPGDI